MGQAKQIRFLDLTDGGVYGGFMLEDGSIVCGCCGTIISPALINNGEYKVLEVYSEWINLSDEIIGE